MFDRNELRTAGTATINGIEYVVIDDGAHNIVYTADELAWADEYVEAEDYNAWCQRVDAIDDETVIAEVCREAGLAGAYTPGSCCWVDAAKDVAEDADDALNQEVEPN